ncbi:MAG: SLC13 family permease [Candidatus Thorarchaeota archaeon]
MATELILLIFVGTYVAISSEKVNRTATALLGMGVAGLALVITTTSTFEDVVGHVEWHTVLFVTAMMIIVTIASGSGMFQYLAISLTKPSRGETKKLFVYFLAFVFVISLFLDTTTTILIMAPLTIEVCRALDIDFRPFLISEAVVCNFASIPSVVGAVPNLVIAEHIAREAPGVFDAGIMFVLLMPLSIILFVVSVPIFLRYFDEMLVPGDEEQINTFMLIDPSYMIRSKKDFYASILGMGVLAVGFTIGHSVGIEPSMIAIIVAAILLIFTREWVDDILQKVNWGTVFFLVGLFGLVGTLQITGIIDQLALAVGSFIGDNEFLGVGFMIWVPSIISGVIDNIPVSTVLAPIAVDLAATSMLLPYVLVFAVNIGGFLLPIGAPANILAIAMSEKEHKPISFVDFAKIATPLALLMLAIGTGWFLLIAAIV